MTLPEFRAALESRGCKPTGDKEISACCPAHDDKHPSLSATQGDIGIVLHCHAGCSPQNICAALGLTLADLFSDEPRSNGATQRIFATYPYRDADGTLLFEVVRLEPKGFRQRRPDKSKPDGWAWNTNGVNKVLFRLPEIIEAIQHRSRIYVCEGEKDVLAMEAAGFVATCNPSGAGKWQTSYSEALRGADVVLIADKDEPGRKHAADAAQRLLGIAASVKTIELPDTNGKTVKDAADFFAAGGEAVDLDARAEAAPIFQGQQNTSGPVAKPLSALVRCRGDDPNELLRHRFICRGGGLLLCGPTGIGKSALAMQAMILWAAGRDAFGIAPARPLKSLLVQSENDEGDVAEMRDGVIAGLHLTKAEAACANVLMIREDEHTGAALCSLLNGWLAAHKPDLLWLDPALAYLGGEANAQKDVGGFLRNQLNPLLRQHNCGAVVVHHTNKPATGREKPNWQAGDYAYLGAGSAEWANWARAVLALRNVGSHDVYELHAGKRGARLDWRDASGNKSYVKHIAHSKEPGVICWYEASPDETNVGGAPKKYDPDELLALLPPEGLTTAAWVALAKSECGVSEATLHRERRALAKANRIAKSATNGKWQPVNRRKRA